MPANIYRFEDDYFYFWFLSTYGDKLYCLTPTLPRQISPHRKARRRYATPHISLDSRLWDVYMIVRFEETAMNYARPYVPSPAESKDRPSPFIIGTRQPSRWPRGLYFTPTLYQPLLERWLDFARTSTDSRLAYRRRKDASWTTTLYRWWYRRMREWEAPTHISRCTNIRWPIRPDDLFFIISARYLRWNTGDSTIAPDNTSILFFPGKGTINGLTAKTAVW